MNSVPRLTALALLALVPVARAAPPGGSGAPAPSPVAAPAPTPASTAPSASAPTTSASDEARARNGLVVSAALRDEYVAGFSMLVTLTVRNDGDAPLAFPDLGARPHLVRFTMKRGATKWERFTTPPATEPTTAWTLAPRSQRQVTLEIPSSAGLEVGDWSLAVTVKDPSGDVALPQRTVRLARAQPVGGGYRFEETIQQTQGAMIPWVHKGTGGFDLYLLQLAAKGASRVVGQFHLGRYAEALDPVLTQSRPSDAGGRYLYWAVAGRGITVARLEGYQLRGKPRTVSVPYPKTELLGEGATDAQGGVVIPLWTPDPSGAGGTVRALCVDSRGGQVLREVAHLAARPALTRSAVDAGGSLLLAMGHAAAIDLYRVDPTAPKEIGARGARVTALADGWSVAALAFDTLPDRGDRPGGLALLSLLTNPTSPTASYRTLWSDLGGKTLEVSAPQPWSAPGPVRDFLPNGYGPFYYLSTDARGASWYGVQGGAPQKLEGEAPGVLWMDAAGVRARRMVPGTVFEDRTLGPLIP